MTEQHKIIKMDPAQITSTSDGNVGVGGGVAPGGGLHFGGRRLACRPQRSRLSCQKLTCEGAGAGNADQPHGGGITLRRLPAQRTVTVRGGKTNKGAAARRRETRALAKSRPIKPLSSHTASDTLASSGSASDSSSRMRRKTFMLSGGVTESRTSGKKLKTRQSPGHYACPSVLVAQPWPVLGRTAAPTRPTILTRATALTQHGPSPVSSRGAARCTTAAPSWARLSCRSCRSAVSSASVSCDSRWARSAGEREGRSEAARRRELPLLSGGGGRDRRVSLQ